jgi:hypothetical protein
VARLIRSAWSAQPPRDEPVEPEPVAPPSPEPAEPPVQEPDPELTDEDEFGVQVG